MNKCRFTYLSSRFFSVFISEFFLYFCISLDLVSQQKNALAFFSDLGRLCYKRQGALEHYYVRLHLGLGVLSTQYSVSRLENQRSRGKSLRRTNTMELVSGARMDGCQG